jgi:hypothetical protein
MRPSTRLLLCTAAMLPLAGAVTVVHAEDAPGSFKVAQCAAKPNPCAAKAAANPCAAKANPCAAKAAAKTNPCAAKANPCAAKAAANPCAAKANPCAAKK